MGYLNEGLSRVKATDSFRDIEKLEKDLWEAADNLRANSKLTSSDYFMPVLGVIFLRHAANRFDAAHRQIEVDQASGKMPKRKVLPADYISRRSLYLPEKAGYDYIMQQAAVSSADLPKLVTDAMTAIEAAFEPLQGVLPKDYGIFEPKVLEDLMRLFNSEQIKEATGDVFGRIYEYFLAEFSIQKAHDNGEFFTPSSLVQTIVNVIEPDHGTVFDPACGSGGMFVQSIRSETENIACVERYGLRFERGRFANMPRTCDLEFFERHKHENFSTAFLAFSLRRSDEFSRRFISLIFQSAKSKVRIPTAVSLSEIKPNFLIPSGDSQRKRPDLVLVGSADGDSFVVAIEVKRRADFHQDQLHNYRLWLNDNCDERIKLLATLTTMPCSDGLPDVCLNWKHIASLLRQMESQSSSDFEKSFWREFAVHVETIMRSFHGFTSPSCDMLGILQQVDAFLLALFEMLDDSPSNKWAWSRAAYRSPKLDATVGFYWCKDDFFIEPTPNQLCVEKNKTFTNIASLSEVMEKASATVNDVDRERYLSLLADRIQTICGT